MRSELGGPKDAADYFPVGASVAAIGAHNAERAIVTPRETVPVPVAMETDLPKRMQRDIVAPRECGVNGCKTWYEDALVMKRHLFREHGIGEDPAGGKKYPGPKPLSATRRLA